MSKPREFWIDNPEDEGVFERYVSTNKPKDFDGDKYWWDFKNPICVIEKSAADKLAEALEKVLSETDHPYLEQALKEYRGEK